MSLEMISRRTGHNSEDPFKEVSALQFLKAEGSHPNVIEVVEVRTSANYKSPPAGHTQDITP